MSFDRARDSATRRDNRWSAQEVRNLRRLLEAGVRLEDIATQLGRTPSAVRNKALMHGISLRVALIPGEIS